jgi:ABC-type branched-subunit amino acid transport system substrate-binding protein
MRLFLAAVVLAAPLLLSSPSSAEGQYAPGVTDTEIKIGNTTPYSGPASAVGTVGKAFAAYFAMVNEHGGVNGRKITFISLDDGYSPPKTVEQTRRLVEQEGVAFMFAPIGTPTNSAIQGYLNEKRVPQLFLGSNASKWNQPKQFPWSMAFTWAPNYAREAGIEAEYIRRTRPDARIAALYQNDDSGKDYLRGFKQGLGANAPEMLVAEASFEVTDPTVDSQMISLMNSKADTLLIYSVTPKACSQAIRTSYDLGWRPVRFIASACVNPGVILKPAGLERAEGLLSLLALKDPTTDPEDAGVAEYLDFMRRYMPGTEPTDLYPVYGVTVAAALVVVLKQCGDNLTRENIMRQAANLHGVQLPLLRPGITLNTSPDDYAPIKEAYLMQFDGKVWRQAGGLLK